LDLWCKRETQNQPLQNGEFKMKKVTMDEIFAWFSEEVEFDFNLQDEELEAFKGLVGLHEVQRLEAGI